MDPWLDSLSEDWVSQPHSSSSLSLPERSPSTLINTVSTGATDDYSSGLCKGRHSSSASTGSTRGPGELQISSQQRGRKGSGILVERHLNRAGRTASSVCPKELDYSSDCGVEGRGRHVSSTSFSTRGQTTQRHRTIQQKSFSASPPKNRGALLTPPWRRRLLGMDAAGSNVRDLFSPIGLESIFQPPPTQPEPDLRSFQRLNLNDSFPSGLSVQTQQIEFADDRPTSHEVKDIPCGGNASQAVERTTQNLPDLARGPLPLHRPSSNLVEHCEDQSLQDDGSIVGASKLPDDRMIPHPIDRGSQLKKHGKEVFHCEQRVERSRTVSGEGDDRDEDLTPIFISKHNTVDGTVDYAASDPPVQRLHDMRWPSRLAHDIIDKQDSQSHPQIDYSQSTRAALGLAKSNSNFSSDGVLDDGCSILKAVLKHIDPVRRSSASNRNEPRPGDIACPLKQAEETGVTYEIRHLRGKSDPVAAMRSIEDPMHEHGALVQTMRRKSDPLNTPPSGVGQDGQDMSKPKNSASPLKLFGSHDTFTNNRLLRRICQFESSFDHDPNIPTPDADNTKPGPTLSLDRCREGGVSKHKHGDFDQYYLERKDSGKVSAKVWLSPATTPRGEAKTDAQVGTILIASENEVSELSLRYRVKPVTQIHPNKGGLADQKAQPLEEKAISTISGDLVSTESMAQSQVLMQQEPEAKRPSASLIKDRTPKRRKTLTGANPHLPYRHEDLARSADNAPTSEPQGKAITGKKRKDARYDVDAPAGNPGNIAMRRIFRLSDATSSQWKQQYGICEERKLGLRSSGRKGQQDVDKMLIAKSPPGNLERRLFLAQKVGMLDESRKGSVQTQDFLDEAEKVMEFIRAKGSPQRNLASQVRPNLGESEVSTVNGPDCGGLEDRQESTLDDFSRPPSRDGRRTLTSRVMTQQDPKTLSYLRGYAEPHGVDMLTNESLQSLSILHKGSDNLSTAKVTFVHDQQSNIRIRERSEESQGQDHISLGVDVTARRHVKKDTSSQESKSTSGTSSSRTLHTGSTSHSDTKLIIGPSAVSHLVCGEIAGMTYDHAKQAWVKRKPVTGEKARPQEQESLTESEEDPLRSIPDLSVNEAQEMERIKKLVQDRRAEEMRKQHISGTISNEELWTSEQWRINAQRALQNPFSTLTEGGSKGGQQDPQTNFEDSTPLSACDLQLQDTEISSVMTAAKAVEEVEAEIQAHGGREPQSPDPHRKVRQLTRDVSITLSSPIMSHKFQFPARYSVVKSAMLPANPSCVDSEDSVVRHRFEFDTLNSSHIDDPHHLSLKRPVNSTPFPASRRASLGLRSFLSREISRIDECEEYLNRVSGRDSAFNEQTNLEVTVSAPVHRYEALNDPSESRLITPVRNSYVTFHLSPLPDFTINQIEEPLGLETTGATRRRGGLAGKISKHSFSIVTNELIQKLTDVEPYDPYWDAIQQLDVRGRGLVALHGLDEFCPRVVELDASNNEITQLTGAPSSIRFLKASHNCLSGLTAWGHLRNLQYLDVSRNEIDSLRGFCNLVHLRELRANNNNISSLEGVLGLDGLIKLDISQNVFESLDFAQANMSRLSKLEARGNKLVSVENLGCLPMLERLNLDDNKLSTFKIEATSPLWKLRALSLSGNMLEDLNIGMIPDIRSLHVDRNAIVGVNGLSSAKHLECFSMRDQNHPSPKSLSKVSFLDYCQEARELYLSGNLLPAFNAKVNFLNLHHLELATSGLQVLPPGLGYRIANVRTLNLNFNALKDISPLVGIVRLEKLLLAGNRVDRLRRLANTLSHLRTLEEVDVRNNPLTLGFYHPVINSQIMIIGDKEQVQEGCEHAAEQFLLPLADADQDDMYRSRLDIDTKLRRRVYELLLAKRCGSLRSVDGLIFERDKAIQRDVTWDRLIALGVLHETQDDAHKMERIDAGHSISCIG